MKKIVVLSIQEPGDRIQQIALSNQQPLAQTVYFKKKFLDLHQSASKVLGISHKPHQGGQLSVFKWMMADVQIPSNKHQITNNFKLKILIAL